MLPKKTAPNFQYYAVVYDALYGDKDYEQECRFINETLELYGSDSVNRIVDIGCGTGGHAIPLAQCGYDLYGIDRSSEMLEIARDKTKEANLDGKIKYILGNATKFDLNMQFDAAICMFAVLSYQISNSDLFSTISSVRKHLNKDGLFIGDFWYGPAVLKQRPSEKIKKITHGNELIIRVVKPDLDTQDSLVRVNYEIFHLLDNKLLKVVNEVHTMRFLFKKEIEFYLDRAGFRLEHFCPAFRLDKEVEESDWNAMFIARAI